MNTSRSTAMVLRAFVIVGIIVMLAGLLLSETAMGDDVLWAGMLILISSPLAGLITTLIGLISEKDLKWAKVAIVLLAVMIAGVVVSIY